MPADKNKIYYHTIQSPLGEIFIAGDFSGLYVINFSTDSNENCLALEKIAKPLNKEIKAGMNEIIERARQEFHDYFSKKQRKFVTPCHLIGTEFQKRVWKALMKLPYGKTCSYRELATSINQPKAFRAVAQANGRNRLPIIIPCHRVINADGRLGGYSAGLDRKIHLLELERS